MHSEHADNSELNELSGRVIGVQKYRAKVHYKDILVGEYFVDLLINGVILVELKTVKSLDDAHMPPGT
jgi:GxxExxY protein